MSVKQPKQFAEPYGYEGKGLDEYVNQKSPTIIIDALLNKINFESALDIGCGIGIWSKALIDKNIDVVSLDGEWVPKENLKIPSDNFFVIDITEPLRLNRKFDLVLCLEVAEHIPESKSDILLNNIVDHGNVVLFSAAIPGQGGFEHVNEQWQSYWVSRFAAKGYACLDILRPIVWGNEDVKFYYQQNILIFVKEDTSKYPQLASREYRLFGFDLVHPQLYNRVRNPANISLRNVLRYFPEILKNYFRK